LNIGIVGKYVTMPDAYLSVAESVRHAGFAIGAKVNIEWLEAERVPSEIDAERLKQLDGVVVPGGFGERGIEGMIATARICRENNIPYLGICLGMQIQVIEFARHCLGLLDAHSTEFSVQTQAPVIALMAEQVDVTDMGGTMRLGAWPAMLEENSTVAKLYGSTVVSERHRHRYEFNARFREEFEAAGMLCSGTSPDGRLVEFVEVLDHPFMVGTQAHPEFKSRPDRPHPLFVGLVGAADERHEGRAPHIISDESVSAAS
jgi:CTP synthase